VQEQWHQQGVRNLEAVEIGLREALFRDACALLEELLNDPALPVLEDHSRPGEKCHAGRPKTWLSLFGSVSTPRNYYYGAAQQAGRAPLDQALGLWDGYSPGVLRVACRAAARLPFETAAEDLRAYCGLGIQGRQIQRITQAMGPKVRNVQRQLPPFKHESGSIPIMYVAVDGKGVPVVPEELVERKGKAPDGSAKTREVKLGCVFTQTSLDEEGLPMRDYQSTSFLASFDPAAQFMVQVRHEAIRRRMAAALVLVLLGDGALWIWEQGRKCFPLAIQILDLYHALEHLSALTKLLEDQPPAAQALWQTWREQLLTDEVAQVLVEARQRAARLSGLAAELAADEIGYFHNNQDRMLYGTYRALGLFYGSGVVEAGCKTLIGGRCTGCGMFWSVAGATNVLDLRCSLFSNQYDQAWDQLHQSDYLRIRPLEPTKAA
jgi:hypothetical protein